MVGKTIEIGAQLESPDPRVLITLERIELCADRKMRWYFTFWNQSAMPRTGCVYPLEKDGSGAKQSWVTDERGNSSGAVGSSMGNAYRFELPQGEKLVFWIDFEEPLPGAKVLTAWFWKEDGKIGLPTCVVPLTDSSQSTGTGEFELTMGTALVKGVVAWVEVDGVKAADWEVGKKEVTLTLPAGQHRVRVMAAVKNKTTTHFDKFVVVTANIKNKVQVGK